MSTAFLFSFPSEEELKDTALSHIVEHLFRRIADGINVFFRFFQYPRERAKCAKDEDQDGGGQHPQDDEPYRGDEEEYL